MQQLIKIGKLTRLHGIKGNVVLHTPNNQIIDIKKTNCLFLEINDTPTPFFVQEIKMLNKNLVIAFDTITTIEEAQKIIGKEVLADEKHLVVVQTKQNPLAGYTLIDEVKGNIGTVIELLTTRAQQLLSIKINEQEALLPYVDEFVKKIDHKTKTIYYCAPDGLIDIYLD